MGRRLKAKPKTRTHRKQNQPRRQYQEKETLDNTHDPIGFAIRQGITDLYGSAASFMQPALETGASAIQRVVTHLKDDSLVEEEYLASQNSPPSDILPRLSKFMPHAVTSAVNDSMLDLIKESHGVANNATLYLRFASLAAFTYLPAGMLISCLSEEAQPVIIASILLSAAACYLRILDESDLAKTPFHDNIISLMSLPVASYLASTLTFNTALHYIPMHIYRHRVDYAAMMKELAHPLLCDSLWQRVNEELFLSGNQHLRSDATTTENKFDRALKRWVKSMPVHTNNMEFIAYIACVNVALMLLAYSEALVVYKGVELTLGEPYVAPVSQLKSLSALAALCSIVLKRCPAGQINMLNNAVNVLALPANHYVKFSGSMVLNGFSAVLKQMPQHAPTVSPAETPRLARPGCRS